MTKHTPFRNYLIPDEAAEPPESGRYAFTALISAVTAIDFDIEAIIDVLAQKSSTGHGHVISDIEGLAGALDSKMPSSRTFKLDDLSDVEGAEGAQEGYILVKTPTGWLPQSALAAVGNHEHTIAQVFGLTAELAARASLGPDGKVLAEQLPALTTTATVGAALAGANGKSVPADGDRFSGILAGASTVFWTTWAGIKAALAALFVSKAGDTMTGALTVKASGSTGGVRLMGGDVNPGYLEILNSNGVRTGYVGSISGTRLVLGLGSGYTGWSTTGDFVAGGIIYAGGGNGQLRTDGNVYGAAYGNDYLTNWVEGRAGAHQNAAANRCVTASRMAGFTSVQPSSNSGAWENSGYVMTYMQRLQSDAYVFGARQPQLFIANIGWFAAFPF